LPDPILKRQRERIVLTGDLPSPANPPSGRRFRTRCQKFANELTDEEQTTCIEAELPLIQIGPTGHDHLTSCHYAQAHAVL
jgi:peptide/nickel transport system ATP-binding protein/oligopeptide transport system ATP-binding protein